MQNGDWIAAFKVGTWTSAEGRTIDYTEEDIDAIVDLYNNQDESDKRTAPVVVGHPETDSPAYGWIEAAKREGDVLWLKLVDMKDEFMQWVEDGHYRERSISLYANNLIKHLGFLGGVPPAVPGLPPVKLSNDAAYSFSLLDSDITNAPTSSNVDISLEQARAEQLKRCQLYGIKILQNNGNITKPKGLEHLTDEQFGDPVNYLYPISTNVQVVVALRQFGNCDWDYSRIENTIIYTRILSAAVNFGLVTLTPKDIEYYTKQNGIIYSFILGSNMIEQLMSWVGETYGGEAQAALQAKYDELQKGVIAELTAFTGTTLGAEAQTALEAKLVELQSAPPAGNTAETTPPAAASMATSNKSTEYLEQRVETLEKEARTSEFRAFCISNGFGGAQLNNAIVGLEFAYQNEKQGFKGALENQRALIKAAKPAMTAGHFAHGEKPEDGAVITASYAAKRKEDVRFSDADKRIKKRAADKGISYQNAMNELQQEGSLVL